MKPKSVISWLVILTLAIGVPRGVTAAGDSLKNRHAKGGYTLTQLDDETSVANSVVAGTFYRDDETSGTFFWSQATGLIDIGSLGGDEIRPTGLSETGTIVGYGETAAGETHAFVWSGPGTLVDLGTLGGDFSFANAVNGNGLIVGYSTAANGWEHAFAWTAADGMIALGTLGGPRSSANFVNDAGMIVGTSNAPGHQGLHAFVWTAAAGMVEMPSLGRLDAVWAMSANGSFAGFSSGKKSVEDQHAVLWTPATASASLTQADAKSPVTSTVALEVPVGDER